MSELNVILVEEPGNGFLYSNPTETSGLNLR